MPDPQPAPAPGKAKKQKLAGALKDGQAGKRKGAEQKCGKQKKRAHVVEFVRCPTHFAPSIEACEIEFRVKRNRCSAASGVVRLQIHDKQGALLHETDVLNLDGADRGTYKWDGKASDGKWASPVQAPLSVSLAMTSDGRVQAQHAVGVIVKKIYLWVDHDSNKLFMNDPDRQFAVVATVAIKKSNGVGAVTEIPIPVEFTHSDPNPANTASASSFEYAAGKRLGKAGDAAALHYASHADSPATSTDAFESNALAPTITAGGADRGKAKLWFKPSGVGGDSFELHAKVKDAAGNALAHEKSGTLVVWRAVSFDDIHEMQGQTQVSTNGTTAIISPVFNPAFVRYTAGAATPIPAAKSVKYIGLWKDSATPQRSWVTLQAKLATETPTAAEIADATYSGADAAKLAARTIARAAINAKAQAWTDRIDGAFVADRNKWISDAAIPANALVSIQYYHPKYSHAGGDFATNEWKLGGAATPAWLRVGAFKKSGGGHYYTNLDPDGLWVNWGGLSHGSGRVSVPKGNSNSTTKQVVRHEAGHATKAQFKRDVFGPSLDHSASNAGIMYYTTAGGTTFTTREKKILRGITP